MPSSRAILAIGRPLVRTSSTASRLNSWVNWRLVLFCLSGIWTASSHRRCPAIGGKSTQGLAHVDWRGRGGYVVAPPSRHASGHPYQWAPGRDLDTPPGTVPAVLLERLQPHQFQRSTG